ncbi:MAG: glycosyltransferase [Pseudomonadota bacterium]
MAHTHPSLSPALPLTPDQRFSLSQPSGGQIWLRFDTPLRADRARAALIDMGKDGAVIPIKPILTAPCLSGSFWRKLREHYFRARTLTALYQEGFSLAWRPSKAAVRSPVARPAPQAASIVRPIKANRTAPIFVGYDDHTGLAENKRMMKAALQGISGQTAFHLRTAQDIPAEIQRLQRRNLALQHIGFLLWEFPTLPKAHQQALDLLDQIWVPSEFVRSTYANATQSPVINVGKGLSDPGITHRREPGIRAAIIFDANSSVERKNPLAAVRAFQNAFPRQHYPTASLTVKTTPFQDTTWGDPFDQLGQIRRLASEDRRICLIETLWPFEQVMALIARSSCLISAHRSEGFGYMPARALQIGTPVIATDYSGTRDFCTTATAWPVRSLLVETPEQAHPIPMPNSIWADPKPDDLAAALAACHDAPNDARSKVAAGKDLMARYYSLSAFRARCEHALKDKETDLRLSA